MAPDQTFVEPLTTYIVPTAAIWTRPQSWLTHSQLVSSLQTAPIRTTCFAGCGSTISPGTLPWRHPYISEAMPRSCAFYTQRQLSVAKQLKLWGAESLHTYQSVQVVLTFKASLLASPLSDGVSAGFKSSS